MNQYARFDEIPSMNLKDIKKTKRYGRTNRQTDGWTDNVKTVYPPINTVCGGYNEVCVRIKMNLKQENTRIVFPFRNKKNRNVTK